MKVRVLREIIEKAFTWGYYAGKPRPPFGDPWREVYDAALTGLAREFANGQIQITLPAESELEI